MSVKVIFNKAAAAARIQAASKVATAIIANEFLKDANYYARMDTGELVRSSQRASSPEEGELVWDTPYAKKMYYTGTPSLRPNPNASKMWAHKAHRKFKDKYNRLAQMAIKKGV